MKSSSRLRGDTGASTVEMAILWPITLMALVFAPLAGGLWWWGRQSADAAADQAVVVGSRYDATPADVDRAVHTVLSQAGYLTVDRIHIDRNSQRVIVEIEGRSMFHLPVSTRREAPIERVYTRQER